MQTVGSIFATILILWGVFTLFTQPATQSKPADLKVTSKDHIRGDMKAPVTIIEYSDFQCPACSAYEPMVRDILKANPKTVRIVYRHFPLDQHVHAREASYAAEAGGAQGKFFEFHDMLFDTQKSWESEKDVAKTFRSYAQKLKLDMKKYDADRVSKATKERVESDHASALTYGVDSTPTFFINGVKIDNPRNKAEFQKAIDDALKAVAPSPKQK